MLYQYTRTYTGIAYSRPFLHLEEFANIDVLVELYQETPLGDAAYIGQKVF